MNCSISLLRMGWVGCQCTASDTVLHYFTLKALCLNRAISSAACRSYGMLRAWVCHVAVSIMAAASFGLEDALADTAFGPIAHASWHCLAAAGMMTSGSVLKLCLDLH